MIHLKLVFSNLIFTLTFITSYNLKTRNLFVLQEWKEMDLRIPLEINQDFAENVKNLGIPIDFALQYKGSNSSYRVFFTLPRLTLGIPYTLAMIDGDRKANQLVPYPDFSAHSTNGADCKKITSAIRVFIDECQRLWVVDSGQIASIQLCPPQIFAFDLKTDELVQRFVVPQSQYIPAISVFTSMIVDCGVCNNSIVYIADSWGFGLIVYDVFKNTSWRIEHSLMRPDNIVHRDGIFSISVTPKSGKGRYLLFHSLGSKNEIFVPLHVINDRSRWMNKIQSNSNDFKILGNRGVSCESEAMDDLGNLYCSVLGLNALIKWNSRTKYNSDNLRIYAYNPEQIKFVTGMKILKNSFGQNELWMLSNEPKLFYGGEFEKDEIKFRLIGCRIRELLNGQNCTVGAS